MKSEESFKRKSKVDHCGDRVELASLSETRQATAVVVLGPQFRPQ